MSFDEDDNLPICLECGQLSLLIVNLNPFPEVGLVTTSAN
jgi:hypothetical protein